MRSGDSLRRDVLRMAANAAYNVEKKQQNGRVARAGATKSSFVTAE